MILSPTTAMSMPELAESDPIAQLLAAVVRKRYGETVVSAGTHAHWGPEFFGLDRVGLFNAASPVVQSQILEECGRSLIAEAFYIEKAGVAFAAKMVLLAESTDERKLYALFGADEAVHLHNIARCYHTRDEQPTANPFLALLSELIDGGDRQSLQVVIQVVLEGWGLTHYRNMRDACRDRSLEELLVRIVADEAAHHGSGVALIADRTLGPASASTITDVLARFLSMVQAGPIGVYTAVARQCGPLSSRARRQVWSELEPARSSAERLSQLQHLMGKCAALSTITERLRRAGAFEPNCQLEPA